MWMVEKKKSFFRLRKLYVHWTLGDINFDIGEVARNCGGILRRRDASLWLCLTFAAAAAASESNLKNCWPVTCQPFYQLSSFVL